MSWAANRPLTVIFVAVTISGIAKAEEAYLQLQLDRPMTQEMRLALARVLDPSTNHVALIHAFSQAVPATVLADQGTLPANQLTQQGTILRPLQIGIDRSTTLTAFNVTRNTPGIEPYEFSNAPGDAAGYDDPAFIVVERDSDVTRAYLGAGNSPMDNFPIPWPANTSFDIQEEVGIAVPTSGYDIVRLDISGQADPLAEITPLAIDSTAIRGLALLDRDVEVIGVTNRSFRLSNIDNIPQEALTALNEAWANAGLPIPGISKEPPDVEIVSYVADVAQMGSAGVCDGDGSQWPFDVDRVKNKIATNFSILEKMGILHFDRTEVMVLDSGMPGWFAANGPLQKFLYSEPAMRLSSGVHTRSTSLKSECTYRDRRPHRHQYGYVIRAGKVGESCQGVNVADINEILPPRLDVEPVEYFWDHGGVVSALIAGGPQLAENAEGLDRLVALSFARIMREEDGALRADAADVLEAIDFAAKKRVPILNLSLKVKESVRDEIFDALLRYWESETLGLVVAAAGNSGGPLSSDSSEFPASAVVEPQDNLIVVGGVERDAGGNIRIWESSSRSPQIIDIAAPSRNVRSFDGNGSEGCYAGTSVAAPQVSFVAAVLHSIGLTRPADIKRRILATADISDGLATDVRHGRILNVENALDVFVDLLWRDGSTNPERVQVLGHPQSGKFDFVRLCGNGAETQGWVDLNRLHAFEHLGDGQARIWRDANVVSGITDLDDTCNVLDSAPIIIRTAAGEEEIHVADIERLVPSRFRAAIGLVALQ